MKILVVFLFLIGLPIFAQEKNFDGLIIRFGEDSVQTIARLQTAGFIIKKVSAGKIEAEKIYEMIEVFFTVKTGVYKSVIWGNHENNSFDQELHLLTSDVKPQDSKSLGRSSQISYTFKTSLKNNSELVIFYGCRGKAITQTDLNLSQNINLQESD